MGSSGKGTTILVLGILSIVCCQLLGPVAFIMGNNALAAYGASDPGDRQLVVIGRILGIIGTVLLVLSLLWTIFFGGLGMLGAMTGGGTPR